MDMQSRVFWSRFLRWHTRILRWALPRRSWCVSVACDPSPCPMCNNSFGCATQYTPRPHTQSSLSALRTSLKQIGDTIKEKGTPPALGPVVIGLTGCSIFCCSIRVCQKLTNASVMGTYLKDAYQCSASSPYNMFSPRICRG